MNPSPNPPETGASGLTREQLRKRIQESTKEAVILDDMQRLGFWPHNQGEPDGVQQLVAREDQLVHELQRVRGKLSKVGNPQSALKQMRLERMAAAKARREQAKQDRAKARFERASAWHDKRQHTALYLGEQVSAGLHHTQAQTERLQAQGLPLLPTVQDLAEGMGISVAELRFLAFDRAVAKVSHYRRFELPKKTGGMRLISAPMPRLKRAQYWVLDNLLAKVPVHEAAHGFRAGRSICSNATAHVGKAVVVNLDLKDFFPSISYPRIKGVFHSLGYSEELATVLGLLCTELPAQQVQLDGQTYFVADGERHLPQGAPSSPALTNILCRKLDRRLQGMAAKLGFAYTRYADDLTFSCTSDDQKNVGKLLWRAQQIVQDEGFTPHPDKQHVMRASQRQQVTGVVVNSKPSIERETYKRFRATVFQVEQDGPAGKQWNGNANVIQALLGYAHFMAMVDAQRGAPWVARVKALAQRHSPAALTMGLDGEKPPASSVLNFRQASAAGQKPWANWWQPAQAAAPKLETTDAQRAQVKKAERDEKRKQQAQSQAQEQAQAASSAPQPRAARAARAASARAGQEMPAGAHRSDTLQQVLVELKNLARGDTKAPLIRAWLRRSPSLLQQWAVLVLIGALDWMRFFPLLLIAVFMLIAHTENKRKRHWLLFVILLVCVRFVLP